MLSISKMTVTSIVFKLFALLIFPTSSLANEQCYDMSGLISAMDYPVGTTFNVQGTQFKIMSLRDKTGTPLSTTQQGARVFQSNIAGGIAPEVQLRDVKFRIIPDMPVKQVSIRASQHPGVNDNLLLANIGINGDRLQLIYGLGGANELVLGNNQKGQILIDTDLVTAPPNSSGWITGNINLDALDGSISGFTIGARLLRIDDICLTSESY